MLKCSCSACRDFVTIRWTRLAGDIWVLSVTEQPFDAPSLLAAVDPAGEAIWFEGPAPVGVDA